jgi:alanine-glyoxylate transaminase/serine-glyoxylate transaminase/serine-pyruvate transaminase
MDVNRDSAPLLMIPGPTNLDARVIKALSLPQVSHTSQTFYSEFKEIVELTKYVFQTKGRVVVFSGSGTSGMESSAASMIESGDRVLSVETGFFGRRFTTIAKIYGASVDTLVIDEGKAVTPQMLENKLSSARYDIVLLTHVETSTGVINPVKELAAIAKKHGCLTVVDTVCSLGGCEFRFDDWGVDVAFAGSQKAIAAPPGAMLMAISEHAVKKMIERKTPVSSYYYDLKRWLPIMEDPRIYLTTPSTAVLRALLVALRIVKDEQLEKRWQRHLELSNAFRTSLELAGAKIFAERPAPTVTAVSVKDSGSIVRKVLTEYNIMVSRGLDAHSNDIIRVGHMGNVNKKMLDNTLKAMLKSMQELGEQVKVLETIELQQQVNN